MINRRRFMAVARKESIHVLRDWRSLALALAVPIMLIVLFGYALNLDIDNVAVVVWDQSSTPESREYVSLLNGSPYFHIAAHFDNYHDIQHVLDSGNALLAVVIGQEFARKVAVSRPAQVQVLLDASDPNTARIALGYINGITAAYGSSVISTRLQAKGIDQPSGMVELVPRAWYNSELSSVNNIVPGVLVIVMVVIAALLTSTTIAKEWELGTMEQLISTPVRVPELILGKLTPYFVIGIVDVVVAVLLGKLLFDVPLRGSAVLVFGIAALFLLGAMSQGILISINMKTQVLSIQLALMSTYLPTMLLSGFVFATYNMPQLIQYLTYLIPARYFLTLLRAVYLKGVGLSVLWLEALLIIIWMVLLFSIANRRLKLKLD